MGDIRISSTDEIYIGKDNAGISDGLADSFQKLFHCSTSPFLHESGVFYISLSTGLSGGSTQRFVGMHHRHADGGDITGHL